MDSRRRGDSPTATEQVARFGVTPSSPWEKTREVLLAMFEESGSVYSVEGIREVRFQKNGGRVVRISFTPLSCCLKAYLSAERLRDADLQRKEHLLSLVLVLFTQALAGETAERFTHSDGVD